MKVFYGNVDSGTFAFEYRCPWCQKWNVGNAAQLEGLSPLTCTVCEMSLYLVLHDTTLDVSAIHGFPLTGPEIALMKPLGNALSSVVTVPVTASAGANGSIDPSGTIHVVQGEDLEFIITPDEGWWPAGITVDGDFKGTAFEYRLIDVISPHAVACTFTPAIPQKTLHVVGGSVGTGSGSVSLTPDLDTYDLNSTVTLTANPSAGSHFLSWAGDITSTTNPYDLLMDADKTIEVNFNLD